jgi:hypothetical protein
MFTVYRSLQEADLTARPCELLSHSTPNNIHAEQHRVGVSWEEVKRLVIENGQHFGGRTCDGCIVPTVNKPVTKTGC